MPPPYSGRLNDPEFRHQRAKNARAAQNSVDHHIKKIVAAAPDLSPEQRDKLRALLTDTTTDVRPEVA